MATINPEAYDFYLRGRSYMYSMARRDYEHAHPHVRAGDQIDRTYALAYAGMADAYSHLYRYVDATTENVRAGQPRQRAGRSCWTRESAEAHASRGLALVIGEHYDEAEQEFEIAITLNPNLFDAWCYYGMAVLVAGRLRARGAAVHARRRGQPGGLPDADVPGAGLRFARPQAGRDARAPGRIGTLDRHIQLNPHDTRALYLRATNLYSRRREGEAPPNMAEHALEQAQNEPVVLYNVACFYVEPGRP